MNPEKPPQFNNPPSSVLKEKIKAERSKLSLEQMGAMKLSVETGKKIQGEFPQIALDYVNGLTAPELVEKYDIQKRYGIPNQSTARAAVSYALIGYAGRHSPSYPALIRDPDILKAIGEKHKKASAQKTGKRMSNEGRGMFARTDEEIIEVGRKSGTNLFRSKQGIHAQTPAEKREVGRVSALRRGFVPFSEDEEAFITSLDLESEEYRTRGKKLNAERIAKELNDRFHGGSKVRRGNTVGQFLRRIKERNDSKII